MLALPRYSMVACSQDMIMGTEQATSYVTSSSKHLNNKHKLKRMAVAAPRFMRVHATVDGSN
jgi:hypothetical protein